MTRAVSRCTRAAVSGPTLTRILGGLGRLRVSGGAGESEDRPSGGAGVCGVRDTRSAEQLRKSSALARASAILRGADDVSPLPLLLVRPSLDDAPAARCVRVSIATASTSASSAAVHCAGIAAGAATAAATAEPSEA